MWCSAHLAMECALILRITYGDKNHPICHQKAKMRPDQTHQATKCSPAQTHVPPRFVQSFLKRALIGSSCCFLGKQVNLNPKEKNYRRPHVMEWKQNTTWTHFNLTHKAHCAVWSNQTGPLKRSIQMTLDDSTILILRYECSLSLWILTCRTSSLLFIIMKTVEANVGFVPAVKDE